MLISAIVQHNPPGGGGGEGAAGLAKALAFTRPNFANFVTLY